ncbi:hypothetical protein KZO85_00145 [Chromohalobacter canadensis]|uniref:hypothetical protein n=1 Tax=Chromohalobacter canadensis TaxID=141389 RepID=UPI0021C12541|nr:hypothetical protein [Chromohalobacter canadensis]MCT8466986.1 hypothetical protein [Chromohalobacter canadensis]
MQCDCRAVIEAKLKDRAREALPEGYKDLETRLDGYALILEGNGLDERAYMEFTGSALVPKKRGDGFKKQKISHRMIAGFCPFCGKPAKPEAAVQAETSADQESAHG